MSRVDLNLLIALDALLIERSVTGAARRLGLSVSAMSRTLARLRALLNDPLLQQAGRVMVLTPRAAQLSQRLPDLTREVQAALGPADSSLSVGTLEQCFTLRAGEGFIELLAAALMARIHRSAPRVQLRFVTKPDWNAQPLRDGTIDMEIGTVRTSAPELRTLLLFRDRYVGVCRRGHPILGAARVDLDTYLACQHVVTSRAGEMDHPVDRALEALGLQRSACLIVPAYTHAMQVVRRCDALAVIPLSCMGNPFAPDHAVAQGLAHFELPVATPAFSVCAIWHPRLNQDPAQRWFRAEVRAVCEAAYPQKPSVGVPGGG